MNIRKRHFLICKSSDLVKFAYFHEVRLMVYFILFLILSSCALNAEQEAQLNRAINRHLSAMNEGRMLQYLSEIHPTSVKYFKTKGDDIFKAHFSLVDSVEVFEPDHFQDPIIVTIEKEGSKIHVEYEVLKIQLGNFSNESTKYQIIAISEDDGGSWLFLHDGDYFNEEIFPASERLIKKK